MEQEYLAIVVFGPPGVGKGAQSAQIKERRGLAHLSTGDLIRNEIRDLTSMGHRLKEIVDRGDFVDDQTILKLVKIQLDRPDFQKGFVLDGFPRNVPQAEILDELLARRDLSVAHALMIVAPDEVILKRLTSRRVCSRCKATYNLDSNPPRKTGSCDACGGKLDRREDDDPEVQKERLVTYYRETSPLAEYYQRTGVLREIDGNQTIENVGDDIDQVLDKVPAPKRT